MNTHAVLKATWKCHAGCFVVGFGNIGVVIFACCLFVYLLIDFCLLLRPKKPGEDYRKQLLLTAVKRKRKRLPDPRTCLLFLSPRSLFLLANL